MPSEALIWTDMQNDFMPGGALGVPGGDAIIPVANRVARCFELVVATQDWHPPGHVSFAETHGRPVGETIEVDGLAQYLWPVHCVEGTKGADFATGLDRNRIDKVIHKGDSPEIDSYSTFFDNGHRRQTELHAYLQSRSVRSVYLCGLATDYCVKFSALDARRLGYDTFLIADACRGVEVHPGDVERAIDAMREAGVVVVTSDTLLRERAGSGHSAHR